MQAVTLEVGKMKHEFVIWKSKLIRCITYLKLKRHMIVKSIKCVFAPGRMSWMHVEVSFAIRHREGTMSPFWLDNHGFQTPT